MMTSPPPPELLCPTPMDDAIRRQRAEALLNRHSPEDIIAATAEERRRWVIDAMIAFANEERRRD